MSVPSARGNVWKPVTGVAAVAVVSLFVGLCVGVPVAMVTGGPDEAPNPVSPARMEEVRQRRAAALPSLPDDPEVLAAQDILQIGSAMGGFLITCELPQGEYARNLRELRIESRRYWLVSTPAGQTAWSRGAAQPLETLGSFSWSGASADDVGSCAVRTGTATVSGRVVGGRFAWWTAVAICGVFMEIGDDHGFEGDVPIDTECTVMAHAYDTDPDRLTFSGDRSGLQIELIPRERRPVQSTGLVERLRLMWSGPPRHPGEFEVALAADELSPQTRDWLEWRAAVEISEYEARREGSRGRLLWRLFFGKRPEAE